MRKVLMIVAVIALMAFAAAPALAQSAEKTAPTPPKDAPAEKVTTSSKGKEDDPATGISIRCAQDYKLVKGDDPSGREDKCVPEDEGIFADPAPPKDGDAIVDPVLPKGAGIIVYTLLGEEGNAASDPKTVTGTETQIMVDCVRGYVPKDGEYVPGNDSDPETNATAFSEDGDLLCPPGYISTQPIEDVYCVPEPGPVIDLIDDLLDPKPGMIEPGVEPLDPSLGDVVSGVGNIGADLVNFLGYSVWGFDMIGEGLNELGEEIGGPLGYGLQAVGGLVGFAGEFASGFFWTTGDAISGLSENLSNLVDGAADVTGDVVDAVGDAAEAVGEAVADFFGF